MVLSAPRNICINMCDTQVYIIELALSIVVDQLFHRSFLFDSSFKQPSILVLGYHSIPTRRTFTASNLLIVVCFESQLSKNNWRMIWVQRIQSQRTIRLSCAYVFCFTSLLPGVLLVVFRKMQSMCIGMLSFYDCLTHFMIKYST